MAVNDGAIALSKMHGCGNDYIVLDAIGDDTLADGARWRGCVAAMCDRRRGIGADGVIAVTRGGDGVDAHAEVVNADGSPGGMCGNGIRMVAKLLVERGYAQEDRLTIAMGDRVVAVEAGVDARVAVVSARADMGAPVLALADVPVDAGRIERVGEHVCRVGGHELVFVSMGNPHAVCFVDALPDAGALRSIGNTLEHHEAFPARMNVQMARIVEPSVVEVVTWERGAGATMACGTGACAVCVAGRLLGKTDSRIAVHMPGGVLSAAWDESADRVWLEGPVAECFRGEWAAR